MLDKIRTMIAETLALSTEEVNRVREALLQEQATADASYATTSALMHPEGSTTPINEAYSRAQDRVARLRRQAAEQMPRAFASLLALEIATERRDEAMAHRDMKQDQASAKDTLGVNPAVADFWGRVHRHGVHPHHLKQQADEMVAIFADLLAWKAKDPKFKDAINPWREVLAIYAGRRIEKPGYGVRPARSVRGTTTRDRHIKGAGDYMFNEMVEAHWDLPAAPVVTQGAVQPAAEIPASLDTADSAAELTIDTSPDTTTPATQRVSDFASEVAPSALLSEPPPRTTPPPIPIDRDRAQTIAEAILQRDGFALEIYWPDRWTDYSDFGSSELLAALEAYNATVRRWSGSTNFFEAVKAGQGREFIAGLRRSRIGALASDIFERKDRALEQARSAGFMV